MFTNSALPSGDSVSPVSSQPAGPTRKRSSVVSSTFLPTLVTCVAVVVPSVLVMVGLVPSDTRPGIAASSMQLVTSV